MSNNRGDEFISIAKLKSFPRSHWIWCSRDELNFRQNNPTSCQITEKLLEFK